MESILSIHDEVYPLKCRRKKSSAYLSNTTNIKTNTVNISNSLSVFYQYIKTMIAQRSVYILGILNLILASIAIACVTQAEDHPEYFSLVYIAVSVFIFYMGTIIFIIILQIIETYREQCKTTDSSSSIEIPLLIPKIQIQSNPVLIQNSTGKSKTKTSLSRSQTLPLILSSPNPQQTLLTVTSSSTFKDLTQITSTHSPLLPKHQQSSKNLQKNYQSFALTTNDQLYPSYTTITDTDSNLHSSSLIKPIPSQYPSVNNDNNRLKVKFSEY